MVHRDEIIALAHDAQGLEQLYRSDSAAFETAFAEAYPQLAHLPAAAFWQARLAPRPDASVTTPTPARANWWPVVILAALAGTLAKLPEYTGIDSELFYSRHIGYLVFPFLAVYFARQVRPKPMEKVVGIMAFAIPLAWINGLPNPDKSDTIVLACIHLPFLLYFAAGYIYTRGVADALGRRVAYLRYCGDLAVISAVLVISGGLLTAITLGLFDLINMNITTFYMEYVVVYGAVGIPIVGTHLVHTQPQLVHRVSPVVAKVFTPLVLVTLVVYLLAVLGTGSNPYSDREFLLVFNALLIGVMAIVFFAVSGQEAGTLRGFGGWLLLALAVVTVVVNAVSLSAILWRIGTWGFTPNRTAVLGGNLLMLIHLLMVCKALWHTARGAAEPNTVQHVLATYLPVYTVWTAVVVFILPFVFGFK
jgi:hypothetical protein